MEMMSVGLILIGVMVVGIVLAAIVVGLLVLMRKSGSESNSGELAYLRHEVARLNKENERLREEVKQFKSGPKAAGSTDIRSE
jgi:outer membrane murein-binding lipoprotein Lpp